MTNSDPRYRNDQWTLSDDLGMGRAGDQVARMALEVEPPFTLGVTGKWGSGKTSVLRRAFATLGGRPLQQKLLLNASLEEGDKEAWDAQHHNKRQAELAWPDGYANRCRASLCVWFSPWQYQNEPNPLLPLLREIQAQFEATLSFEAKAEKTVTQAVRRGGLAALKVLETAVDAAVSISTARPVKLASGLTDCVQKGWADAEPAATALSDGQRFHLLFENAIEEVLTSFAERYRRRAKTIQPHLRLIVFIDDLDRCEEGVVVRLLEAIKLYLSSRRCVFILGLDDGAVLDALRRHWQDRSDDSNREYLEKLFQGTLAVPLPRTDKVEQALMAQLNHHSIPDAQSLAQDIQKLLEPNPRKIKNFVNGFCAAWNLHGIALPEPADAAAREVRRFLLFYYLRLYHRPVWRLLERQPWSLKVLHWVINGAGPEAKIGLPDGVDIDAQRILEKFFFRAFSHVLPNPKPDEEKSHGSEDLDQAVNRFQERQDRKRSDEYWCRMLLSVVESSEELPEAYLYLPS